MDYHLLKGAVGLSDDAMCVAKLKDGSLLREDVRMEENLKGTQRELVCYVIMSNKPGSQLA